MSQGYQTAAPGNGMAIASLVLGLFGLVLAVTTGWIPCIGLFLPIVPTVLAIIFGFVGKNKAKQGAPYGGVAVAGLATGIVGAVLTVAFQILWGAAIGTAVQEAGGIEGIQKKVEEEMDKSMQEMKKQMEMQEKEMELQIDETPKKPGDSPPPDAEPTKDPSKESAP